MPPLPWTTAAAADAALDGDGLLLMASLLRLDSLHRVPGFLRASMAIRRQVLHADGAVGVALSTALPRTFFTVSAWRDREALNSFVRSEPHVSSMRRYRSAMADARFVFWNCTAEKLPPSWSEVERRLRDATSER
jgi:heme-degrading monooxygenase HmoA